MEDIKVKSQNEESDQTLVNVNRTIELNAPDLIVSKQISVFIQAKKFKTIGSTIILCKGSIPLTKFIDNDKES